ncbi:MAG: FAD-binding protein [Planctomycetes bacterium]|nr:FAD-binding protein [Planctomycetota bacterium]
MTDRLDPALAARLRALLGPRGFLDDPESLFVYQSDALTQFATIPLAVLLPLDTETTAAAMRLLHEAGLPVTPRGAGTGLSGGAMPSPGAVVVDTSRMKRVLELNVEDRYAVIEPGLVNLRLSEQVQDCGLFYAPDPSSQMVCTLGGNIAENSGGPHTLKYGATTGHVLGLTVVLEDGEVVELGGIHGRGPGLDLVGAFTGSEGTLGVVTRAIVRLSPTPTTVATLLGSFVDLPTACRAVSGLVAAGIEAAAIEAIDRLTIEVVEASVFAAGYPKDAGAVILVELDGHPLDVAHDRRRVEAIFREQGCLSYEEAEDAEQRKRLWRGRKGAYGAMGRISPDLYVMDCVVPRSKLEEAIVAISAACAERRLRLANVIHAGEGNLHPNISYDGRDADELARAMDVAGAIVRICLDLGGTLSGEHGIGLEKQEFMPWLFSAEELALMKAFRAAFAPRGLMNPGKILPTPRACSAVKGETTRFHDRVLDGGDR